MNGPDWLQRFLLQGSRVVKAPGLWSIWCQFKGLLAPFCCVLGKDTLRHIPLLGVHGKQF